MSTKPLVVAARFKYLLIVPFLIIVPLAALYSVMNTTTSYTSVSRLFAQQSAILDNLIDQNPYSSPAQNRASDLNELLQTDSFRIDVASRIGMPTDTPAQAEWSAWEVGNGTATYANGRHLFVVSHTSSDPKQAQAIVSGIVDQFRETYRQNVELNVERAKKVYNDQLVLMRDRVTETQRAMTEYLGARASTDDVFSDPRYQALQKDIDLAQKNYADVQKTLSDIELQRQATLDGQDFTLRVEDPASLPTLPQRTSKREMLAIPIAGFLLALSMAATLYAFLLRTDNSIRTAHDLEAFPGLVLLGTVPDVASMKKRHWPRHFFRMAVAGLGVTTQR